MESPGPVMFEVVVGVGWGGVSPNSLWYNPENYIRRNIFVPSQVKGWLATGFQALMQYVLSPHEGISRVWSPDAEPGTQGVPCPFPTVSGRTALAGHTEQQCSLTGSGQGPVEEAPRPFLLTSISTLSIQHGVVKERASSSPLKRGWGQDEGTSARR